MLCVAIFANAQIPFAEYHPVIVDNKGNRVITPSKPKEEDNFKTIYAYYINDQGRFQKTKIKINEVSLPFGGTAVYVRAYYDVISNIWQQMNTRATEVNQYSYDSDIIKENFEYKCRVLSGKTVYF